MKGLREWRKFRYAAVQCGATFSKSISRILKFDDQFGWIDPNQIVRIGVVELIACALVEHVRVDPVGSQQRDTLLALGALPLQPRQFRRQRDDFLIELLPRIQPILAGIGVDAEIADDRRRHRIEGEPGQQGFESVAGDHGPEDATARLTKS